MNSTIDLKEALQQRGALLEGHFRLSSGRHSDRFVQKFRILEDPQLVEPVARAIADAFREERPTIVVSAAVGGIVLGYEVARQLGTKAIFVEKEDGVAKLRRSFALDPGDRALVVEDVVTTGLSIREVVEVVKSHGARVAGIGAIVKRGSFDPTTFGGSARDDSIRFHALLDMPVVSYEEAECPQCEAGDPITDPGSRRA